MFIRLKIMDNKPGQGCDHRYLLVFCKNRFDKVEQNCKRVNYMLLHISKNHIQSEFDVF